MLYKKLLIAIICILTMQQVKATDTIPHVTQKKLDILERGLGVATAISIQKRTGISIGLSYNYFAGSGGAVVSYDIYAMGTYMPAIKSTHQPIYGVKAGVMFFGLLVGFGAELQSLQDKNNSDIIFTPKAGLGMGRVHITYGRNVSSNNFAIQGITKNNISAHFNINLLFKKTGGTK